MGMRVRRQWHAGGLDAVLIRKRRATPPTRDMRCRAGSQADRPGVFASARRRRGMDAALAGEPRRRTGDRQPCQRQYDRARSKKMRLNRISKQQWVIAKGQDSAFVAAMEDVLAVYQRLRDPDVPLVSLDETSNQMIADTRPAIPLRPGARPAPTTNTNAREPPISSCRPCRNSDRAESPGACV